MLEPDEGKLSSPVLRGLAPSNGGWPLGIQATDGTRTFTPLDSQPCRLLHGPVTRSPSLRWLSSVGFIDFVILRRCDPS